MTTSKTDGQHGFKLLAPSPDVCQECAVKHEPEQAHNKDSLYYQMQFRSKNGRWPVWKDAIAHCLPEIREVWEHEIKARGAWKEPAVPDACPMDDGTIGTVTVIQIKQPKAKAKKKPKKRTR